MKILFATSEAAPFVKTGGLGDVAGTLPVTLKEKGVDVRVIMPKYRCIPQEFKDRMTYINHIYIDMAWRKQYCGVFQLEYKGCTFYFIDNEFYFNGDKPYNYIHEDVEKFAFFSKAVLSILPSLDFRPDLIHCNDWQTGAIPVYLDVFQDNPFFRNIKTITTIHNLKFQGRWGLKGVKDIMGINDSYFTKDKLEFYTDANLLKGGLVYSDKISTVSNTYANEITTVEYGEGLSGLLSARHNDIVGIVNGISYEEYNPAIDDKIYEKYDIDSVFEKKKINKLKLQEELNLPRDENKFMIGIVSRLTEQKGFDILAQALEQLCNDDVQIVVLGTGDSHYENMFRHFAWKYSNKLSANIYFSDALAHKIYASCDAFLMPSRFEPCGLSQIISLKYGTIPIVRETGGLKDTVVPYNEYTGEGTGFSFSQYSANDMLFVTRYAKGIYYDKREQWHDIMTNAMSQDFSWSVSADKYINLYSSLTGIPFEIKEKKNSNESEKVVKKPRTTKKAADDSEEKPKKTTRKTKSASKTAATASEKAEKTDAKTKSKSVSDSKDKTTKGSKTTTKRSRKTTSKIDDSESTAQASTDSEEK
jgi:starch synthase